MRDLRSRLRAIVSQGTGEGESRSPGSERSLHYEPMLDAGRVDPGAVAAQLGGTVREHASSVVVEVDRVWTAADTHGRSRIDACALTPALPIRLFDPRLPADADWASRVVFFDIETTGLSGGAGTLAFLAGCAWFEDGDLVVRQVLLTGPAGEHALLAALGTVLDEATLLVTFNGRTFDVPTMDTRWAFHRQQSPFDGLPHFDMLPAARRLWGRRRRRQAGSRVGMDGFGDQAPSEGCTLTSLERQVLGFHRLDDVPGFEIPARYFQFLRSGDAGVLAGVLEHNRFDLVSLAAVTARALRLAHEGPETCREAGEQVGLGRLYERAGDEARAIAAFELAASSDDLAVQAQALGRLAVLYRRADRHADAAEAWRAMLDASPGDGNDLSPLERRALEALAVHHEHRDRDLRAARRYAEALRRQSGGASAGRVEHRLRRLDRKLAASGELFE